MDGWDWVRVLEGSRISSLLGDFGRRDFWTVGLFDEGIVDFYQEIKKDKKKGFVLDPS